MSPSWVPGYDNGEEIADYKVEVLLWPPHADGQSQGDLAQRGNVLLTGGPVTSVDLLDLEPRCADQGLFPGTSSPVPAL